MIMSTALLTETTEVKDVPAPGSEVEAGLEEQAKTSAHPEEVRMKKTNPHQQMNSLELKRRFFAATSFCRGATRPI